MVNKGFTRHHLRGSRWPVICAVLVFGFGSVMLLSLLLPGGMTPLAVHAQSQKGSAITETSQLTTGQLTTGEVLRINGGEIHQIAFSPHNAPAIAGTPEKIAMAATSAGLWLINLGATNHTQLIDTAAITAVWWSPSGNLLAAQTATGTLQIWQITGTPTKLQTIQNTTGKLVAVAWSPDSVQFATGTDNGVIELWDASGRLQETKTGHIGRINSLAWSADGTLLLSGSKDGSIHSWIVRTVAIPDTPSQTSTLLQTGAISPTGTLTPSLPPTITAAPIQAIIQTAVLNIRSGPGTTYTKIGSLKQNDRLNVLGQVNACVWLKVQTPSNGQGWIAGSGQYVTLTTPCDLIAPATITSTPSVTSTISVTSTGVAQSTPTPSAPSTAPSLDPLPANQGCYLFQNQLGVELNITVTRTDTNQSNVYKVASGQETPACLDPGHYAYTVGAPPPWASINGQLDVKAGERFRIPVRAQ